MKNENTTTNKQLSDAEKILLEAEEVAAKAKKRFLNKKLKEKAKPAEEVVADETTEVVTETTEQVAEEATEVVEETTNEVSQTPKKKGKKKSKKKPMGKFFKRLCNVGCIIIIAALILSVIFILNKCNANTPAPISSDSSISSIESNSSTTISSSSTQSENSSHNSSTSIVEPETFNMNLFKNEIILIAEGLTTDEDISTNVLTFVDYLGEEKIKTLIGVYGEENLKEAIASYLASVPEEKMEQYIADNNLDYNSNAASEYQNLLFEADEEYKLATGKNPDGALMSLDGYDTYKGNRESIKALILEKGDMDLLTWYTVKTEGYDIMVKQIADTEKAKAYKEEVKLELVENDKLFEKFISENYSEIN